MEFSREKIFIATFLLVLFLVFGFQFKTKNSESTVFTDNKGPELVVPGENQNILTESPLSEYIESEVSEALPNPPPVIRGVYVTSGSAVSKSYILYLDSLFKTTQINTVVIDIKNFSGIIFYNTGAEKAREYKNYRQGFFDINGLVKHFHDQGIYAIARINIFNDVALAKARPDLAIYSKSKSPARSATAVAGGENQLETVLWQDSSGLYWLDPASEEVWNYNIEIAKDVLNHGFDEINFDYIRFPSDGNLEDAVYPVKDQTATRHQVIQSFFKKIRESLPDAKLSVDLFGQTTVITNGDMGVGQVLEDSFGYFNFVSPMVYPSHYISGFLSYAIPSEYPYEVVENAMSTAKLRLENYEAAALNNGNASVKSKLRPWLQDFTLTVQYDANKVAQEIKAVEDALGEDFNGFMLWNPSNVYTIEAIKKTLPN